MDDLTIVTCNHNTPELIENLKISLEKIWNNYNLFVIDTGDQFTCGDIHFPMSSHGDAVNKTFNLINTRYMLLVDSDVLFLKDISRPFEKFKSGKFSLMGEVVGDRGGKSLYPRVNPWFCFMDFDQLKNNNIQFYDHYRTKVLKSEKIYDIGSTMFEDVINAGLIVADVKMEGKYFKHYEGMSWRVQKYNPVGGDTDIDVGGTHDNIALYEYGLKVWEQYRMDVANL